jgi:hypothetical protein
MEGWYFVARGGREKKRKQVKNVKKNHVADEVKILYYFYKITL